MENKQLVLKAVHNMNGMRYLPKGYDKMAAANLRHYFPEESIEDCLDAVHTALNILRMTN